MEATFKQLQQEIEAVNSDFDKFYQKGNKAAGARARANFLRISKLAKELRASIQDTINNSVD